LLENVLENNESKTANFLLEPFFPLLVFLVSLFFLSFFCLILTKSPLKNVAYRWSLSMIDDQY